MKSIRILGRIQARLSISRTISPFSIANTRLTKSLTTCASANTASGVGSNKQLTLEKLDDRLYTYILGHTREPQVLADLRQDTAAQFVTGARMQVSPDQGAFLAWMIHTLQVKKIIEVGVFTGYSSIAMALALPANGLLVACDRDARAMDMAREYWKRAGVIEKIDERLAPAADTLQQLLDDGQAESFDFAFIDADKRGYKGYYELILQLLRPGGVVAVDNVLWYGKVADPEVDDNQTKALRELNDFLLHDERVVVSMVTVGDGITLCTKKAN